MFCLPSHSDLCFILFCDGNDPIYLTQSWAVLKLELHNHLYVIFFLFSKNYEKVKKTLDIIFREMKTRFSSSFSPRLFGDGASDTALVKIRDEHASFLACSGITVNYPLRYSCKRGNDNSQGKALAVQGFFFPNSLSRSCLSLTYEIAALQAVDEKSFSYSLCLFY